MSGTYDVYTEYRDARGNPPNLAILSFPVPQAVITVTDIVGVNVYLKTAGPTYTLLESTPIHGTQSYVEYWFPFLAAVHGEQYAVDWTRATAAKVPAVPIDAEAYYPAVPDPTMIASATMMIVPELIRRVFLVERQTAERAVLLRRKIKGDRCKCWGQRTREALRDCEECYGTGFTGGYDVFPRILLRFHPQGQKIQLSEAGLIVDTQPRGHTPIIPIVTDRDIFVRTLPQGLLGAYEVNNPTRKTREGPGGVPVLQEFSLRLHEAHMPIYRAISELVLSGFKAVETADEPGLPQEQ